ncbi:MAG: hypothetical protein IPN70_00080 [Candidatus Moraniibacteriota bacterium]|nr:MAG: hypothetical protein IPN70_00080 [Candidatus Moranbacteria bacterium]
MINIFLKIFFYLSIITFQIVFVNVLFPYEFFAPNVIVFIALAWILLYGFDDKIIGVLILGFLYDSLFFESFGFGIIPLLLSSYGISLLSRRIVSGRKILGIGIISLFVLISLSFFQMMTFFGRKYLGFNPDSFFVILRDEMNFSFWYGIISLIFFWIVYGIVKYFYTKRYLK